MSRLIPARELPGHARLAGAPLVVLALCADWCGTCREFRPVLERLAAAHADWVFAWADIEDDAELVGDIDVDDFPTLAVFRNGKPLHFGAALPLERVVARLLQGLQAGGGGAGEVAVAVMELGRRLGG